MRLSVALLVLPMIGPASILGCASDGEEGESSAGTTTAGTAADTSTVGTSMGPGGLTSTTTAGTEGPDTPEPMDLPIPTAWDVTWTLMDVGDGSKSAISADGSNGVHIAYMWEEFGGWVRHVNIPAGATMAPAFTEVAAGYFYGPIDVGAMGDGTPVVAYHDHDSEDQVLAIETAPGNFGLNPMGAPGHDGWYPALFVDGSDVVHTASFDPTQFGGVGVNYGRYDGAWTVETAAAGSFDYKNGVSIEVAGDGTVYIAYFDDGAGTANIARKPAGGAWESRVIEAKGGFLDAGYFPQMRLGSDDTTLHLTYLVRTSPQGGTVRYAVGAYDDVALFNLAPLDDLPIGMPLGTARTPASIALQADDTPIIAYQNGSVLRVAKIGADTLEINDTENVPAGATYGRQTAVEITADGVLHLTYWQADGAVPGTVRYGWAAL